MTEANVNDSFLPGKQGECTTKKRIFKFLDGLKSANLTDQFSLTGETNLSRKFSISLDEFRQVVLEYRKGGRS